AVTIDRSDFAARGDSMQLDQVAGFGLLVGKPRVEGKGTESYRLTGTRIELGLRGHDIRLVKALGDGVATGADWRLTADTIHLHIDRKKLQLAFAWGPKDSVHARAVSSSTTIRADSLALDVPDQVLTEVRAFGHAHSTMKRDSTARRDSTPDWITGDSLTAHWAQPAAPSHLAALLSARDSSLPLAAAALARVGDAQGRAPFPELAVAYREEFLKLRAHSRGAGLPELGALSVEEFRTSLRTSVLPRLALLKIVTYPLAAPGDPVTIAFTAEVWAELSSDRGGMADRLLEVAERALARAESPSGEHRAVPRG